MGIHARCLELVAWETQSLSYCPTDLDVASGRPVAGTRFPIRSCSGFILCKQEKRGQEKDAWGVRPSLRIFVGSSC